MQKTNSYNIVQFNSTYSPIIFHHPRLYNSQNVNKLAQGLLKHTANFFVVFTPTVCSRPLLLNVKYFTSQLSNMPNYKRCNQGSRRQECSKKQPPPIYKFLLH